MNADPLNNDQPFIVIVGGANMDICGTPAAALVQQDSNPGTVSLSPGGVARNIAENLARLGDDCRLIAAIGADHYGEILLQQGRDVGINMDYMMTFDDQPTSTYLSILDAGGDLAVAINDMTIVDQLDGNYLTAMTAMIKQASIIIADTNLSEEALACLTKITIGQTLMVDTVSATKAVRIKPHLGSVHTLKASLIEAEALCGNMDSDLAKMANWFHEQGIVRVLITLGPKGVYYSADGEQGMEPSCTNSVINASGAGDAFIAAIAHAFMQNWVLAKSLQFAICAASVALSHRSTINPAMSLAAVNKIWEAEYGRHI